MTVVLSLMGIFLFLISKKFLLSADTGKALWSSLLEVPVDANLVGFMLGVATISQLSTPNEFASVTIVGSIILMNVSILVWKYSCSLMSDRDAEVYISKPKTLYFLTIANTILALFAIALPIFSLGAKI